MQRTPSLLGLLAYLLFAAGFIGAKPFGVVWVAITWGLCVTLLGARTLKALVDLMFR
jgi:hypothetical protein